MNRHAQNEAFIKPLTLNVIMPLMTMTMTMMMMASPKCLCLCGDWGVLVYVCESKDKGRGEQSNFGAGVCVSRCIKCYYRCSCHSDLTPSRPPLPLANGNGNGSDHC